MKQIARRLPVRRSGRRPATTIEPHVAAEPTTAAETFAAETPSGVDTTIASTNAENPSSSPNKTSTTTTEKNPPSTTDVPPPQTTETQKPPVKKTSSEPLIEGKIPQDQAVTHSIPTALDDSRLLDALHGSSCHGYWARLLLKMWAADF
ncbi:hypothetical protein L6452_20012 [Arctium lappa]|uniref:Uncharacterized protein n=1 Tax=Arctium lappa TaxID=4217 RepID=A0ACB9BA83_ARCLA|nr:hypothetical protein L6452_20012 [Arctium lappa]